jgi:hypothetical protein
MAITKPTLNEIFTNIDPQITTAESNLTSQLDAIPSGGEVTTAQLLRLQTAIAKYTVTSSVFSAVIKEMSDSLKSMANKIG